MMGFKSLHRLSVAYAATSLGHAIINRTFLFFYVKVYLNRFHVSESWFNTAQIVYMTWNAVNDPMFAYIQDNCNFFWVKSRRHAILYGAPLFVASFLLPWFPWGDYSQPTWLAGVQLMVSLCFYDTLFTFVLLAHGALFAEISTDQDDRIRLIRYAKVASIIGSFSVFFCNLFSHNLKDYSMFLTTVIFMSAIALMSLLYSGCNMYTKYDRNLQDNKLTDGDSKEFEVCKNSPYSYIQQTLQIFSQPSFVSFVVVNLMQMFHLMWLTNFMAIICDSLIPDTVLSSATRSTFYGSLFIIPPLVIITGAPLVVRLGYYIIIKYTFFAKVLFGFGLFIVGPKPWALIIFFLLESVSANCAFGLFNLCLSDVIDIDKDKYKRNLPLSSMVFGANALVTKPAQSLAPMVAVAILNNFGYQQFKQKVETDGGNVPKSGDIRLLHNVMFTMCCTIPVIVGVLQLIVWRFYSIRNSSRVVVLDVDSQDTTI